jgi:transposase
MSKLSYEDKINIYQERKNGKTRIYLSKKYSIGKDKIDYLTRLIDKHGFDILRTTKNRKFNYYEKEQIINRVLINGESVLSVSIDEGLLSNGILFNWIKEYKENCYNIVERKRGRPTMDKKIKPINKEETQEEKIKRLEKENLYLKAELEYSKKLRAVVQARKNQQQKKK